MRDVLHEYSKGVLLYGLLLGSAQLLNRQILKLGTIAEGLAKLQSQVADKMGQAGLSQFWLKGSEILAGVILIWLAGQLVKVFVKHNASIKLHREQDEINNEETDSQSERGWNFFAVYLLLLALALLGSAGLFAGAGGLQVIYESFAAAIARLAAESLNSLGGGILIGIKVLAGLIGIMVFMFLYGAVTVFKHGPILRRVEVDGYAWLAERLSWKNWVIGRKVKLLPFLGKAGVHLPDWASNTDENERLCAVVTAMNYPKKDGREKTYISYKTDIEPDKNDDGEVDARRLFVRYLLTIDGHSKTLVRRAYIEESPRRTRAKSIRAFGEDYAQQEQCLMCLRFNIKRGDGGDIDFEDHDDEGMEDSAGGLDANTFERWDKMGLRRMLDWGPGYKLIFRSRAYDVDMDFFGSGVLTSKLAWRRKFYVRNADNRIVAKLVEVHVWKKVWPILDNNWRIDIYDSELAGDSGMGYVLSLVTQYLRRAHFYDTYACWRSEDWEEPGETS